MLSVMVENVMPKLQRVVLQDVSWDAALSVARTVTPLLPDGCAPYCELSRELLARKFGGIAVATVRPLPVNCAEASETSRENSCGMVRRNCATVLRDSADSSASYWRAAKA
jgi:hypothetical protein